MNTTRNTCLSRTGRVWALLTVWTLALGLVRADAPGLPFVEYFQEATWIDFAWTNAGLDPDLPGLTLDWARPQYRAFAAEHTSATEIGATPMPTQALALGDVNGDGFPDLIVGNDGGGAVNHVYFNSSTPDPWDPTSLPISITGEMGQTQGLAVGDVDGDGDLDVVAAEHSGTNPNRVYLNAGDGQAWVGQDVSTDTASSSAVALGDVDGDGDLDLVVGNDGGLNRLYLNNGSAHPFLGVVGQDIGPDTDETKALALADVDGDGDLDVVAANTGTSAISKYYLNDGDDEPFDMTGIPINGAPLFAQAVALGDVNGDTAVDVILGTQVSGTYAFLNRGDPLLPWSGDVGTQITIETLNVLGVALADVDGDGDLDVVSARDNTTNLLTFNNGTDAPFAGAKTIEVTPGQTDMSAAVVLGDVDLDGDVDFVDGVNGAPNRLYLNRSDTMPYGDGASFAFPAHPDASFGSAVGDLDGDGNVDLVVAKDNALNVWYRNNGTADPFDTAPPIAFGQAHETNDVVVGDFNGDGWLDVVALNHNTLDTVYLNNGSSDPFLAVPGTALIGGETLASRHGEAADLDLDGDLDLVVAHADSPVAARYYLNSGDGIAWTGYDLTTDPDPTYGVAVGDIDRDGWPDVVLANQAAGAGGAPNRFYLNNRSAAPFGGSGTTIGFDADESWCCALADFENDGWLDLVVGNTDSRKLYFNQRGADPFTDAPGEILTTGTEPCVAIAVGNVDGNDAPDLICAMGGRSSAADDEVILDPAWGMPEIEIWALPGGPRPSTGVDAADMDGDGDRDVLIVTADTGVQNAFLHANESDPQPAWNPFLMEWAPLGPAAFDSRAAAVGDVNGDGLLDLVLGNHNGVNWFFPGVPKGFPWHDSPSIPITSDVHNTNAVALGDMDRDGDLDLVVANQGMTGDPANINRIYLNDGDDQPWDSLGAGLAISTDTGKTAHIELADVNRDGWLDVVAFNHDDGGGAINRLYLNPHDNSWPDIGPGIPITTDAHDSMGGAVGDVDRDGDPDVVVANGLGSGAVNRLYLNDGDGTSWLGYDIADMSIDHTEDVELGDLNGDGLPDVVFANRSGGMGSDNGFLLNDWTTQTLVPWQAVSMTELLTNDLQDTYDIELTDLDGDGDLDVVAGNAGTSPTNRVYLNNGTETPFLGAVGSDLTPSTASTHALIAAAPAESGPPQTWVAANAAGDPSQFSIRGATHHTGRGLATSMIVADTWPHMVRALLFDTVTSRPPNTAVDLWLSNDGGNTWLLTPPESLPLTFPWPEMTVMWRLQLRSLSPALSPIVRRVRLAKGPHFEPTIDHAVLVDLNDNGQADAGEKVVVAMDMAMHVRPGLEATTFELPMAGDTLGGAGFEVDSSLRNRRLIVVTLGDAPSLTISNFEPNPSELGLSPGLPDLSLRSLYGIPVPGGGPVVDIRYAIIGNSQLINQNTGGTVRVTASPDAAYTGHQLVIPPGSYDDPVHVPMASANVTFTLKSPAMAHGVAGAVQVETSETITTFSPPATLTLEYKDTDVDPESGHIEAAMRIHQWVEVAGGGGAYVPVGGTQTIDKTGNTVSVALDSLNPENSVGEVSVFASLAGSTIEKNSITIKSGASGDPVWQSWAPQSGGAIKLYDWNPADPVLTGGSESIYSETALSFPGWQETTVGDPDGITVTIDQATLLTRLADPLGGQSFPLVDAALFTIETTDASGDPTSFTAPVNMRIQFIDDGTFTDAVKFDASSAEKTSMRPVEDLDDGAGRNYGWLDGATYSVTTDADGGVIEVTNKTDLTGVYGQAAYGAVGSNAANRARRSWTLYR